MKLIFSRSLAKYTVESLRGFEADADLILGFLLDDVDLSKFTVSDKLRAMANLFDLAYVDMRGNKDGDDC